MNAENSILSGLNGVELVMSLSPKSIVTATQQENLFQLQIHQQRRISPVSSVATTAAIASQQHNQSLTNLQHLQSLHYQHHSSLLNSNHTTPFSVTDILSPIEESYRKLDLNTDPPSPFR